MHKIPWLHFNSNPASNKYALATVISF